MQQLAGMTAQELKAWLQSKDLPSFHASQILHWIYKKGVYDFQSMTNLSKEVRDLCSQELSCSSLSLVKVSDSEDGETSKYLFRLSDGKLVESVLILAPDRRTICVSSQVGCPARCAFCASGKQGLLRQLTVEEIIEQILHVEATLNQKGEKLSHLVFMGMGEPLENYEAVVKSIRLLNDPELFNFSQRRMTLSTVGVVEGIYRLSEEGLKVNLVLSLHAPNQRVRQKIIPYARKYSLESVLEAMDHYAAVTKRDITYEYTLIAGINDQREHAKELVTLLKGKQCSINLIPYNPVMGLRLKRPSQAVIVEFRSILDNAGIVNTCRYTKGDDIAAACGQLALQNSEAEFIIS